MEIGYFMNEATKENILVRSKKLLDKLKHLAKQDMLWIFLDKI